MRSFILLIFIFILFFITIFKIVPEVSADVIIPDCQWNEIKVSCECKYGIAFNDSCNECLIYKNDSKYHSIMGNVYCRKGSILELTNKYKYFVGIPLLITIILEIIVFVIRGYRKIKELLNITLVNCISLPVGYILFPIIQKYYRIFLDPIFPIKYYRPYGMIFEIFTSLIIVEVMVVIFEASFLIHLAKFNNKRKTFITVIIANITSVILGLGILTILYSFLSIQIL